MMRNIADAATIIKALDGNTSTGMCGCPSHDDKKPSLHITAGNNGKILLKCHANCSQEAVISALRSRGLWGSGNNQTGRAVIAEYDYCDENGRLLYQVVRFEPKDFRQRRKARPDDPPDTVTDGWVWSVKNVRRVPYRLPEVLEAIDRGRTVYIVEGEKDVERLKTLGLVATTNVGGAGKWSSELNAYFRDAVVAILPDNDNAGRQHAETVAKCLRGVAAEVRIVDLPCLEPKGDVSDWLDSDQVKSDKWFSKRDIRRRRLSLITRSTWPYVDQKATGVLASELQGIQFPPIEYIVPGFIVEGSTLLIGKPKVGKSWLGLGIAVGVASGSAALGGTECQQGDVLYLALEDNLRRLQRRMWLLRGKAPWPERLRLECRWPRMDEGGLAAIQKWIDNAKDPRLIVIDTLVKFQPDRPEKKGLYGFDHGTMSELTELAGEKRLAIVVVHHERKAEADDPLDTASGTTGLTGGVDAVLALKRDGVGRHILVGRGRDLVDDVEVAIKFERETGRWDVVGSVAEVRRSEARQKVLDALQDGPMRLADMITPLGALDRKARNALDQLLHNMKRDGEIVSPQRGVYELAAKKHKKIRKVALMGPDCHE